MRGNSFDRQSNLASEYARRNGLNLDTTLTFNDLGVSAFRGRNAETGRLGDFLAAVEDGLVPAGSFLLVESLDRISRQSARRALRVLEEIVDRDVTLVTLNDGRAYTRDGLDHDPMSLMLALLTFIRANEESETKARRLVAAWSHKRTKASEKKLTAICPAWLKLDRATEQFGIIPERAAVVRRIFEETLAGRGQHVITADLNRDGVPVFGHQGRTGRYWHRSYVVKILSNPAVIGTLIPHRLEYKDGRKQRVPLDPVKDYFPAVIEEEAFERIQLMHRGTRQPLRGRHAGGHVSNILGGFARCPKCGSSMTLSTKGPAWRYLVCTKAKAGAGCTYEAVRYDVVEQNILDYADQIIEEAPSSSQEADRLSELASKTEGYIDHLNEELEGLLDTAAYSPSAAVATRIATTDAKLRSARQELAELEAKRAATIPARWLARLDEFRLAARTDPVNRQAINAIMRWLLTAVVVDYTVKVLRFQWKHGGKSSIHYFDPPGKSDPSKQERRSLNRATPT